MSSLIAVLILAGVAGYIYQQQPKARPVRVENPERARRGDDRRR